MKAHWTIFTALILIEVGFLGPPSACAHALLDHAEPRVGSTVSSAPSALRLTFTEPLEVDFCRVDVRDTQARRIAGDTLERPKPEELRLALPPLSPGTYTVHWAVTSVDMHQTEGSFEFTVSAL